TNARRVEVGDKKAVVNGKESSTEAQCIGRWPGARQLLTARVSSGPADDLLLLDETSHQLRILTAGKSASSDSVDRLILRPSAVLDSEGAPVTALPMRLNGDALSDLVILQSDRVAPTIVKTAAGQTFTVNKADDHDDGSCDSGDCTLREAINAANANVGADT